MGEMFLNTPEKVKLPENIENKEKDETKTEREGKLDINVFVTDHSPDNLDTGSKENLKKLYGDVARDGIDQVRYDFHWGKLEKKSGEFDQELLGRYQDAKSAQEAAGLKEPIIILSNPPEWAIKLYKEGKKEEFYDEFRKYAEEVKNGLEQAGGKKVTTIQILNELNNKVYTPVAVEDMPELCWITREVFKEYNPDLKLSATLVAGNLAKLAGEDIKEFLPKFKEIKDDFDKIVIDYYPGTWHYPMGDIKKKLALSWPPTKEIFKQLVKQFDLLKEVFEEVASWGKDYEMGETGMPTKFPWGGEKAQRYFYDIFFRQFKHMMLDFKERKMKLPSAVGLYEAIDEPPKNFKGKILDKLTPFPESRFGMREGDGERKMILRGVRGKNSGPSQLSELISYLRAPMANGEDKNI
ncbi:hypothetical protein HY797_01010 [Candidatus Falkowbacteria bacterium]|nr:hypothetical protein [Candidatus Falkowbacteria bacterium]